MPGAFAVEPIRCVALELSGAANTEAGNDEKGGGGNLLSCALLLHFTSRN